MMEEDERNLDRSILVKSCDNPKLFHKCIRSKLSVKRQKIRLKDSEAKVVVAHEEICEELNARFHRVFTVEDTNPQ